jgi:hypothetical protein
MKSYRRHQSEFERLTTCTSFRKFRPSPGYLPPTAPSMPHVRSIQAAILDLQHARDDIMRAGLDTAQWGFTQLCDILKSEPLASLVASTTPAFDFETWWNDGADRSHSMSARPQLQLPHDLAERVAAQIAFVKHAAADRKYLREFMYRTLRLSDSMDKRMQQILQRMVDPLIRDLQKLAELRPLSPAVEELFRHSLPSTGDDRTDALIEEARSKFQDNSFVVRKEALERLWDAWERLKTLCDSTDKRRSADLLISAAAREPNFRDLLTTEAHALTQIGNNYQIRHFESGKIPVLDALQVDYLFHRCFAMVWLFACALSRTAQGTQSP